MSDIAQITRILGIVTSGIAAAIFCFSCFHSVKKAFGYPILNLNYPNDPEHRGNVQIAETQKKYMKMVIYHIPVLCSVGFSIIIAVVLLHNENPTVPIIDSLLITNYVLFTICFIGTDIFEYIEVLSLRERREPYIIFTVVVLDLTNMVFLGYIIYIIFNFNNFIDANNSWGYRVASRFLFGIPYIISRIFVVLYNGVSITSLKIYLSLVILLTLFRVINITGLSFQLDFYSYNLVICWGLYLMIYNDGIFISRRRLEYNFNLTAVNGAQNNPPQSTQTILNPYAVEPTIEEPS